MKEIKSVKLEIQYQYKEAQTLSKNFQKSLIFNRPENKVTQFST